MQGGPKSLVFIESSVLFQPSSCKMQASKALAKCFCIIKGFRLGLGGQCVAARVKQARRESESEREVGTATHTVIQRTVILFFSSLFPSQSLFVAFVVSSLHPYSSTSTAHVQDRMPAPSAVGRFVGLSIAASGAILASAQSSFVPLAAKTFDYVRTNLPAASVCGLSLLTLSSLPRNATR
jgi:hypothetical protein